MILNRNRKLFYDHRLFEPARKYSLQRGLNIFENGVWSKVGQHEARNIIAVGLEASVLPALESDHDFSLHWLTSCCASARTPRRDSRRNGRRRLDEREIR